MRDVQYLKCGVPRKSRSMQSALNFPLAMVTIENLAVQSPLAHDGSSFNVLEGVLLMQERNMNSIGTLFQFRILRS